MNVKFKQWECTVSKARYYNGRLAIVLVDNFTGALIARATLNLPDDPLTDDEVAIKDYSENEGILDALVGAGIVEQPHRFLSSGFIGDIPVCKVNAELLAE